MTNLVVRMRDLWKRIEPGTDDAVLMMQVCAILVEASARLERLEGEHENITRGRVPTHRCKVCDTFWIDLGKMMTMCGIWCGETCCEGANIEKLPAVSPPHEPKVVPPCPSVHDHMWAEDGHCMRCYAQKSEGGS